MVPTKKLMLGITLATLCHPVFGNTTGSEADKKQQLDFLSFIAFIGSVTELESAGIDVDQLLADPSQKTPASPEFPKKETETDE